MDWNSCRDNRFLLATSMDGVAAVVLGIIGLFSPQKGLNWAAIIIGAIALALPLL
jgi:hypothetical protein